MHGERLAATGQFLLRTRSLWGAQPFMQERLGWEEEWPGLSDWLRSLGPEELEAFEKRPEEHPGCPGVFTAWFREAEALCALESLPSSSPLPGGREAWGVKERKWRQVRAFSGCTLELASRSGGVVDWCAGKGHLGRMLGLWSHRPFLALERQEALCDAGLELAVKEGVSAEFRCCDVLDRPSLPDGWMVAALHACGELSDAALEAAVRSEASSIALSPCCFHAIPGVIRQPSSSAGRSQGLLFTRLELRLPSTLEVVASPRIRMLRRKESAFRAGLDILLRQAYGLDGYTPLPSSPRSWIRSGFEGFCRRMSDRHGLALPCNLDFSAAERAGWERSLLSRALAMVRSPFRRAVELWVTLDRALWMEEQGWTMQLGTFCSGSLTPRNIALLGKR